MSIRIFIDINLSIANVFTTFKILKRSKKIQPLSIIEESWLFLLFSVHLKYPWWFIKKVFFYIYIGNNLGYWTKPLFHFPGSGKDRLLRKMKEKLWRALSLFGGPLTLSYPSSNIVIISPVWIMLAPNVWLYSYFIGGATKLIHNYYSN